MYQYISLVWNKKNESSSSTVKFILNQIQASGQDWNIAYQNQGMAVLHSGEHLGRKQAYPLNGQQGKNTQGVILGKLFENSSEIDGICNVACLNEKDSNKIIDSGGKYLVAKFWGKYTAFLDDQKNSKQYIIRDPLGLSECYFTTFKNVNIYFSDINFLASLDFLKLTISNEYLAAYLRTGLAPIYRSGLREVKKMARGECVEITGVSKKRYFIWNPEEISQSGIIENPDIAASELRQTTNACIKAWASNYGSIIHKLSGGLDSSIVLSCLMENLSPNDVTCLNYYTANSYDSDERIYARIAAEENRVLLVEEKFDFSDFSFDQFLAVPMHPEPHELIAEVKSKYFEGAMARDYNAEAVFCGSAGDNIFYNAHRSFGASDYYTSYGLRPTLLRIMLEAARIQNISLRRVISFIIKHSIFKNQWDIGTEFLNFDKSSIHPNIKNINDPRTYLHPWVVDMEQRLLGKRHHIFGISVAHAQRQLYGSDVDFIDPLMSQPLIEKLLKIPSWILTTGGRDRGLTRRAFQKNVPSEIITRESKGSAGNTYKNLISEHINYIRDFILGGSLANRGLLNQEKIEKILSKNNIEVDSNHLVLINLMSTEAWCRTWGKNESL